MSDITDFRSDFLQAKRASDVGYHRACNRCVFCHSFFSHRWCVISFWSYLEGFAPYLCPLDKHLEGVF